mmetsp:Transcript_41711/g.69502  ORF Transcript_41711/g.69502 Transcript_41711/m.69502 type:complete len:666 (+) Transcript_41711:72-2069(+)
MAEQFSLLELSQACANFASPRLIGQGAFGSVYKGVLRGREVAIKRLRDQDKDTRNLDTEAQTLGAVSHPNVINLRGISADGSCLVYPFLENGSLQERLLRKGDEHRGALNWKTRMKIAAGVAAGLAHLHSLQPNAIIHCDIKSANVLLDVDYVPKITDFGVARFFKRTVPSLKTNFMSKGYASPQLLKTGELDLKNDVYAFGVVLLELITGRPPVIQSSTSDPGQELSSVVERHISGGRRLSDLADSSAGNWPKPFLDELCDVAQQCIAARHRHRPTMAYVAQRLMARQAMMTDEEDEDDDGPSLLVRSRASSMTMMTSPSMMSPSSSPSIVLRHPIASSSLVSSPSNHSSSSPSSSSLSFVLRDQSSSNQSSSSQQPPRKVRRTLLTDDTFTSSKRHRDGGIFDNDEDVTISSVIESPHSNTLSVSTPRKRKAKSTAAPRSSMTPRSTSSRSTPLRPREFDCQICMDAVRQVYFEPCHHVLTCRACGSMLKNKGFPCPLCDSPITNVCDHTGPNLTFPLDVPSSESSQPQDSSSSQGKVIDVDSCVPSRELQTYNACGPLVGRGPWYMISCTWVQKWLAYCTGGSPRPGPIDNISLVGPDFKTPKPWLKKSAVGYTGDYRVISKKAWDYLFNMYGGGPTISRPSPDLYPSPSAPSDGPIIHVLD